MTSMLDDSYYASPQPDQRMNDANHVYEDIRQVNLDFNPKYRYNEENGDDGNYMRIQRRDRLYSTPTTSETYAHLDLNPRETKSKKNVFIGSIVIGLSIFVVLILVALAVAVVLTLMPTPLTNHENKSLIYSFNRSDLRRLYMDEANLVKQTELNLSCLNISSIEPNTFRELNVNIQSLSLTSNRISALHFDVFGESLRNLEHLYLSFNRIDTINGVVGGVNLAHLVYLKTLYLDSNSFAEFNLRKLAGLAYLEYLDLSSNRIVSLGGDVSASECKCMSNLGG